MFEVQILVPSYDNDNNRFESEVFQQWETKLIETFGGYSRYPGIVEGGWADGGKVYRDEMRVYGLAISGLIDGQKVIETTKFAQTLFKQEAMFIRYLGQTEFVS